MAKRKKVETGDEGPNIRVQDWCTKFGEDLVWHEETREQDAWSPEHGVFCPECGPSGSEG